MSETVFVNDRKIYWLASYPKSGNTWVRMFLNAYMTGFPLDINSAFQYIMGDNNPCYFQLVSARPVDKLTINEQFCYRSAVLMNLISQSPVCNITLKTHHAKVAADGFVMIPPTLSKAAVYIVRDPRDVAISYADHLGVSIDTTIEKMNCGQFVAEHKETKLIHMITSWSIHVKSWTDANNNVPTTVFRYEDMLENSNEVFKDILKALGVIFIDEDRFAFAMQQTQFNNLQRLEEKGNFREKGAGEKFFRVGKCRQWHSKLNKQQIRKIEKDHGEYMRKWGYEPAYVKC